MGIPVAAISTISLAGFFMEHPHRKRKLYCADAAARGRDLPARSFHGRPIVARLALPDALKRNEALLNYGANPRAVYFGRTREAGSRCAKQSYR
jgi:hypothetical protein